MSRQHDTAFLTLCISQHDTRNRETTKNQGVKPACTRKMQKHDNALMLMDNPRSIYETLTSKRCSDTHWAKIKRLATASDIPLDSEGLQGIIALRKINPRYFNLYPEIRSQLSELGLSLGDFGLRISGENLVHLINERLNISPDITTVYRWFYRADTTFKRKQWYDRKTAMMVLTNALIYKAKTHRIGA